MINETLNKLGLGEKETAIYLAVLGQGKATPAHIAQLTKINRTTVYSVAKDLVKKGFISEDLGGQSTYLLASPPQDLKHLVQKEEKELENKKKLIDSAITELQNFSKNTKYAIPKINFIQEEDLENYLYKRSDEWHASIMKYDGILWGFQDHTFAQAYEKWIDWEWRTGGPKDLRLRLFSNESGIEEKNKAKEYSNRRQIKYWRGKENFTGTIWVHGDYLILVQTRTRPHYLVEIYDQLLASNMREFFKGIWEQIK
jgi:sugar-specific transcriptional regulator TrmB